MRFINSIALFLLTVLLAAGADAQTRGKQFTEFRTIAQGDQSGVDSPFVFIARDAATYELLRGKVEGLPEARGIDFTRNAVAAGFAGTKRTGGYAVVIGSDGKKNVLRITSPPRGAMVIQALTTPFTVALIPVEPEKPVQLELPAEFKRAATTYTVRTGEFEYSGGFAFRGKKFKIRGTIATWRHAGLVTADFRLTGTGKESKRILTEIVSGSFDDRGFEIGRLDAGSFSEDPKPPLKVTGSTAKRRLSLKFTPLPTNVADGFSATGQLEAVRAK